MYCVCLYILLYFTIGQNTVESLSYCILIYILQYFRMLLSPMGVNQLLASLHPRYCKGKSFYILTFTKTTKMFYFVYFLIKTVRGKCVDSTFCMSASKKEVEGSFMSLVATSVSTYFFIATLLTSFLVAKLLPLFIIKSLTSNLDHSRHCLCYFQFFVCAITLFFAFCCGNSHLMDELIPC